MSGRVPSDVYMRDPTASWYGMWCIAVNSAPVDGDWPECSLVLGSMGFETGLRSSKLKWRMMDISKMPMALCGYMGEANFLIVLITVIVLIATIATYSIKSKL
jgi:hypothetical protein